MNKIFALFVFVIVMFSLSAAPAFAQNNNEGSQDKTTVTLGSQGMQYYTPRVGESMRFEAPKFGPQPEFEGLNLDFGLANSLVVQDLKHSNSAVGAKPLIPIRRGVTLPNSNLYLGAQLAPGIRSELTMWLASSHHNETWVKDGVVQIDQLPIDHPLAYLFNVFGRVRAGMMELNYGDLHFTRSDGGRGNLNPFIDNALIDSFTIEPAVEGYFFLPNFMFMAGVTSGQNKGDVVEGQKTESGLLLKTAYDGQITNDAYFRISASLYRNEGATNTIFGGDRTNSDFSMVMEPVGSTTTNQFRSGRIDPKLPSDVTTWMLNPYIKYGSWEFLGAVERMQGKGTTETEHRAWSQYLGQVVYHLTPISGEVRPFVGFRYNTVNGNLDVLNPDVTVVRQQLALGSTLTKYLLMKLVYTDQSYQGFDDADIRHGGHFNGISAEMNLTF